MKLDNKDLESKAAHTIDVITEQLTSRGLSDIIKTYKISIEGELLKLKLIDEEKTFNDDDFMRISFEMICYAIFLIIVKHSHNPLRTNGFQTFKLEPEQATFYNKKLVILLDEFFKKTGYTEVHELVMVGINEDDLGPVPEFGEGEPLTAYYRLKQYTDIYAKEGMREVIIFYTQKLSNAIEPINLAVIQPYAYYYANYTDEYLQKLLAGIFK